MGKYVQYEVYLSCNLRAGERLKGPDCPHVPRGARRFGQEDEDVRACSGGRDAAILLKIRGFQDNCDWSQLYPLTVVRGNTCAGRDCTPESEYFCEAREPRKSVEAAL